MVAALLDSLSACPCLPLLVPARPCSSLTSVNSKITDLKGGYKLATSKDAARMNMMQSNTILSFQISYSSKAQHKLFVRGFWGWG